MTKTFAFLSVSSRSAAVALPKPCALWLPRLAVLMAALLISAAVPAGVNPSSHGEQTLWRTEIMAGADRCVVSVWASDDWADVRVLKHVEAASLPADASTEQRDSYLREVFFPQLQAAAAKSSIKSINGTVEFVLKFRARGHPKSLLSCSNTLSCTLSDLVVRNPCFAPCLAPCRFLLIYQTSASSAVIVNACQQ